MTAKVLVIEDDHDTNQLITAKLRDRHYNVESAEHGDTGYRLALDNDYDLIVLDLMLPGMDGLEICQHLRGADVYTPLLMLTAKDSEADRVIGLEMGADDCLPKPFSVRELQARVKALLRRAELLTKKLQPQVSDLEFDGLKISVAKRQVVLDGRPVTLTGTEFDLLLFLARQPGHVFSREQLLNGVWGYQHGGYAHTVNSHINRLRSKLERGADKSPFVLTVWGVGYKFNGG